MSPILDWIAIMKTVLLTFTVVCTLYIAFLVGPVLETKLFPVLDPLQIDRVEYKDEDNAYVYASFNKRRACEYVGTAWYKGLRSGEFDRVLMITIRQEGDNSSPTRPQGRQHAGPWLIGMNAKDVVRYSFVDIFHRCHPFWITRTNWYP